MAEAAAAAAGGGDAGAAAAAAAASKPWYEGVAGVMPEYIGQWQNRGLDKKTPAEAAVEITKSWLEAQKFVGVPAEQIVRVPKEAKDEAGWNAVWARLGKPTEAKGYDLSGVKRSDGAALDTDTDTFIREQSFKLNLPKDTAAALAQEIVKREDGAKVAAKVEADAKLAVEKTELAKNWGPNFEANKFVATRAAAALGLDPATVSSLEGVIGYSKIMEMFRAIGSKIGEDKFVTATGGNGTGVMTREQAVARKKELMNDKAWTKSYLDGDATKGREMTALNTIIVG